MINDLNRILLRCAYSLKDNMSAVELAFEEAIISLLWFVPVHFCRLPVGDAYLSPSGCVLPLYYSSRAQMQCSCALPNEVAHTRAYFSATKSLQLSICKVFMRHF